jgi:3-oxoacyl-[acyl-carrier-protein] synthase-1
VRRVVVTGVGIVSSLGHSFDDVARRLAAGASGITRNEEWAELGLAATVAGSLDGIDDKIAASSLTKRRRAAMGEAALYCCLAALDAVADARLEADDLAAESTACIVGSGIGSTRAVYDGGRQVYGGRPRRVDPYGVLHAMASSCSAAVSNLLGIRGRSYSLSSACATSSHNVGHAFELVRDGLLERAVAGGGEEIAPLVGAAFAALRSALSTRFAATPERASRPFEAERDGFVLSGGAGVVVLETLERALERGATIHGELAGFAANCDAFDLVLPEPEGTQAASCMRAAIADAGIEAAAVDYVNAHATGTVSGDLAEGRALRSVFGGDLPSISSTKSMGGHALGAAGAHELIHCLAMIERGFVAPSINVDRLDPELADLPVLRQTERREIDVAMSNSFGFGGTNAVLVVRRAES